MRTRDDHSAIIGTSLDDKPLGATSAADFVNLNLTRERRAT